MSLKWVDVYDIAIELCDQFPEQDPMKVSFPELYEMVMALEAFDDDPQRCGEKILEGIQMAWLEELE
ncbi:Fe-S cluster assembly protein IscX [Pontibacter sp. JAM-7]|uniref:Fe-S cluster assembly protein IscX n=1 Tax=Pontibacter sp. JAM-7 TaxID=3366581 RepID=UPI003AF8E026